MNSQRKLVQSSLIPIRWGDMDAYGHVNNTIYFRFMEQCRVEYLELLGFKVRPEGSAPVIINASCTFLVPLNYPGVVDIRMYCGQPGAAAFQHTTKFVGRAMIRFTRPVNRRSSGWTSRPENR